MAFAARAYHSVCPEPGVGVPAERGYRPCASSPDTSDDVVEAPPVADEVAVPPRLLLAFFRDGDFGRKLLGNPQQEE